LKPFPFAFSVKLRNARARVGRSGEGIKTFI
jgi:hypothetical protein